MNKARVMALLCSAISVVLVAGCGGNSTPNASIGGSVTGLAAGTTVGLTDNGTDSLTLSANGNFVFAGKVSSQGDYNVTVTTQPVGQTCLISNGSGLVDFAGDNVGNVAINCIANVPISVVVTGLASSESVTFQLTLQNDPSTAANNFTTKAIANNVAYTFSTSPSTPPVLLPLGDVYSITVATPPGQPSGQACTVVSPPASAAGSSPSGGVVGLTPIIVNFNCVSVSS